MGKGTKKRVQPYILFCTEQEQTVKELSGKTIPQLVEICSGAWSSLGPEKRQRYVDMAKEYNEKGYPSGGGDFMGGFGFGAGGGDTSAIQCPIDDLTGKFDCYGRSELAKQEERRQKKFWEEAMKADINARIERAKMSNKIPQMTIDIVSINTWLELETGEVIPSEIGVVRMSIQDGVVSRYNQMIGPGTLPVGYKSDAKINSEKYHKIWLDNPQLSENYVAVVDGMAEELRVCADSVDQNREMFAGQEINLPKRCTAANIDMTQAAKAAYKHKLRPLYVMSHEMDRVRKGLKWLCDKAYYTGPNNTGDDLESKVEFTCYDLPYFFWRLIEEAPYEYEKKMTQTVAEAHLKSDVFLYVRGVSCGYHDSVESCCCAGGRATRLAFVVCDFCCRLYSQRPLEGRHVPNGIPVVDYESEHSGFGTSSTGYGRGSSYMKHNLRLELESVPSRSTIEDSASDESRRFTDKHILSDVLTKKDGTYYVKNQPMESYNKRTTLPPGVQEQLNRSSSATRTKTGASGIYYSLPTVTDDQEDGKSHISIERLVAQASKHLSLPKDQDDDTISFVSAQE